MSKFSKPKTASSTILKDSTKEHRWFSGMTGFLPLVFSTVRSRAMMTISSAFLPPAFFASSKNLTCPKCSRSNTPEAKTTLRFLVFVATRTSPLPAILTHLTIPRDMRRKLNLSQTFSALYNTLHLPDKLKHTQGYRQPFARSPLSYLEHVAFRREPSRLKLDTSTRALPNSSDYTPKLFRGSCERD